MLYLDNHENVCSHTSVSTCDVIIKKLNLIAELFLRFSILLPCMDYSFFCTIHQHVLCNAFYQSQYLGMQVSLLCQLVKLFGDFEHTSLSDSHHHSTKYLCTCISKIVILFYKTYQSLNCFYCCKRNYASTHIPVIYSQTDITLQELL